MILRPFGGGSGWRLVKKLLDVFQVFLVGADGFVTITPGRKFSQKVEFKL